MIRFEVTVDSELLQKLAMLGANAFPGGSAAFGESAKFIQSLWQGWATGGPLDGIPNIKNPSPNLAQSIKIRKNAPFDVNIVSESAQAQRIQEGTEEHDMKTTHPYGQKSRVTKSGKNKGIPYLIIPIKWGTPNEEGGARAHMKNVIPQNLYSAVSAFNMKVSRKKIRADGSAAIHFEKNHRGQSIKRDEYDWGERIIADGPVNGLVRFPDDTASGGSTYFMFRAISAVSHPESWIKPAVEAVDMLGALEKTARPVVEKMVQAGFRADVGE
jgi:hypothetical protein